MQLKELPTIILPPQAMKQEEDYAVIQFYVLNKPYLRFSSNINDEHFHANVVRNFIAEAKLKSEFREGYGQIPFLKDKRASLEGADVVNINPHTKTMKFYNCMSQIYRKKFSEKHYTDLQEVIKYTNFPLTFDVRKRYG